MGCRTVQLIHILGMAGFDLILPMTVFDILEQALQIV